MNILLIDNGTSLLHKLQKLVGSHEITKKWNNVTSAEAGFYDLIILSGSSEHSVMEDHVLFEREIEIIRTVNKPIIGICFGCELIAYAFGGRLVELKEKPQGIREVKVLEHSVILLEKLRVYEHHGWAIASMPNGFKMVAFSENGPEIIQHHSLPIYGFQFHPENFVDETDGDEVFSQIINSSVFTK